jgi:hypothetical protein
MPAPRNHIKIFVASTVYDFQSQLDAIYELLDGFGYDVSNSHKGTIPVDSSESNLTNCLNGVKICDVFVGFIRPDYGSGILDIGGKSITHQEFEIAESRNIPRFILADYRVTFARSLLRHASVNVSGSAVKIDSSNVTFSKDVMDVRCIQLYEQMIKNKIIPPSNRVGNWVQEYKDLNEIRLFLESQFKYPQRIQDLIAKLKSIP